MSKRITNRTPPEAAEIAGQNFDEAIAKGCSHVLLRGCKASFALPVSLSVIEAMARETPGARILPMREPSSRIQFIAWALEPWARKAV